jgi:ABC-type Zn uptake system ZnuABC Zn-binding protein ZnuA
MRYRYVLNHAAMSAVLFAMGIITTQGSVWAAANDDAGPDPLRVVASLSNYAWLASEIGGKRVEAEYISRGNQDPHFVRPKPSFQTRLRDADLFITTGLDLELWVPTLLDAAGNSRVLEGGDGYVAAWPGIHLLEKPVTFSRSEGGVHIYGNPHITTDPLNMVMVARNILAGLERIDPSHAEEYRQREAALEDRLYRRLFGDDLVDLLGGETLARLARAGKLWTFLESKEYPRGSGRTLVSRLGGWMKQSEPLRGQRIIGYHKNWPYFANRFGVVVVGHIEPKPGIPPTPRHVETVIKLIRSEGIEVILAANYFDSSKPNAIAARTGARFVTVPLFSEGEPGVDNYMQLVDTWIGRLVDALEANDG